MKGASTHLDVGADLPHARLRQIEHIDLQFAYSRDSNQVFDMVAEEHDARHGSWHAITVLSQRNRLGMDLLPIDLSDSSVDPDRAAPSPLPVLLRDPEVVEVGVAVAWQVIELPGKGERALGHGAVHEHRL